MDEKIKKTALSLRIYFSNKINIKFLQNSDCFVQ